MRIHSAQRQSVVGFVVVALITGCSAMQPDIALNADDSVAIAVSEDVGWPGPPAPGRVRVLIESRKVQTGAMAGALAGGAVGLLCGPLAPYCVPMGALHGSQVGMLGGAVVGMAEKLPAETVERLRVRVEQVLRSDDLRGRIEADVVQRMQGKWNLTSDLPTATVEIRLQEFLLLSAQDQGVRCSFKVNVGIREQRTQYAGPGKQLRVYEYLCPYEDPARWLDESQDLIESNLAAASRYLAAEIVAGLAGTR